MHEMDFPCENGEDLRFLAYCAIAHDFSLLLDGAVRLEHLSQDGRYVAQWLLELHDRGTTVWPPDYESLQEQFPELSWPRLSANIQGLDPHIAAIDVWFSYNLYATREVGAKAAAMSQMTWETPDYSATIAEIRDTLDDLVALGKGTSRLERFGARPEIIIEATHGVREESVLPLRLPFQGMTDFMFPVDPGIHATFARPKRGKSFYLNMIAAMNCMGEDATARGLLVDPENDRRTIITRLCCAFAGVSMHILRDIRKARIAGEELTPTQQTALDYLEVAAYELTHSSQLYILDKTDIDPEWGMISLARIEDVCKEQGIKTLFIDQGHKIVNPRTARRNDNDTARIYRAVERLSTLDGFAIFLTTQEKRKQNATEKLKFPAPSEDSIFGGDAVAQNCQTLTHLESFQMDREHIVTVFSPLLNRNAMSGNGDTYFVRSSFFDDVEELEPHAGRALVEALIMESKKRSDSAKSAGKKILEERESSGPSQGTLSERLLRAKDSRNTRLRKFAAAREDET